MSFVFLLIWQQTKLSLLHPFKTANKILIGLIKARLLDVPMATSIRVGLIIDPRAHLLNIVRFGASNLERYYPYISLKLELFELIGSR